MRIKSRIRKNQELKMYQAGPKCGDPTLSTLANQVACCGFLDPWVKTGGAAGPSCQ
jgi:hypothetical protein